MKTVRHAVKLTKQCPYIRQFLELLYVSSKPVRPSFATIIWLITFRAEVHTFWRVVFVLIASCVLPGRQAGTNKEQTPTDSSIPTSTFAAIRFPQFSVGSVRKWMAFCSSVRARIDEETDRRMRGRRRSVANVRTLRDIQTNASGLVRWCGRPRRLDRTQAIRESIVWTLSGQYSAVGAGNIVSVSGQWGRNIDRYQCNVCKLVCLIYGAMVQEYII